MGRCLIVDDSEAGRVVMTTLLERDGHSVTVARDGREALALAVEAPPDVLITDVLMPRMDGFQLCREWSRHPDLRTIPIVVYSAVHVEEADRRLAEQLGAARFIARPQPPQEILQAVNEVLAATPHQDGPPSPPRLVYDERGFSEEHLNAVIRSLHQRVDQLEDANETLLRDLAIRDRAIAGAREAECRHRQICDNICDALIITNPAGRIVDTNPAARTIFGYTHQQLIGRNADMLFPENETAFFAQFAEHLRTNASFAGTTTACRADGETFRADVHGAAIDLRGTPHLLALVRDVTDSHRARQALEESEERYRALFESAGDAVIVVNTVTDRIEQVNQRCADLFGGPVESLTGKSILELVPDADRADAIQLRDRVLAGQPCCGVEGIHMLGREGASIPVSLTISPVRGCRCGAPLAIIHVRDIGERKLAEEERVRFAERIQQAQKYESLATLAGGVAHHFNNLLHGVIGYARLGTGACPEEGLAYNHFAKIEKAARRAAVLSTQLLACSGCSVFTLKECDIAEMLSEMPRMFQAVIDGTAVIEVETPDALPPVAGDPVQLRQALIALVTNAAEALPDSGGTITVRARTRNCSAADLAEPHLDASLPAGEYVSIDVIDNGCGMDADTCERVFDPFFSTKLVGRGLGLAACLGIAKGHRGAVTISSRPGRGTTASLLLPAVRKPAKPPAPPVTPQARTDWRLEGKILLVDDESVVLELGERALTGMGFSVITASDGQEGIDRFHACADAVACVILDLQMPRVDGEEAFRAIRKRRSDVPVIISTAYSEEDVRDRFAGEKRLMVLQKPYRLNALAGMIRDLTRPPDLET